MRIGIYTPYLSTMTGGEKYMLTLASCLAKKHKVDILWKREEEKRIRTLAKERFQLDLSDVHFAPNIFNPALPFFTRFFASAYYDAIIYLSDGSFPLTLTRKLIVHLQFPIEWVNLEPFMTRLKLRQIKSVICNSEFTKEFVDRKLGTASTVIYPPVTIRHMKHIEKENMILHVGRYAKTGVEGTDYKKQGFMLDTFKKMVDKGLTKWKFVVMSSVAEKDQADFAELMEKAKGYPIEFIINGDNDTLWTNYYKAKIYWHASGYGENLPKHPERAEHFGIATVEAMNAGAVPVVINAGGQREIVHDETSGLLWSTQEEMIEKTLLLIHKPKLCEELAKGAQERAQFFVGDRFCQEVQALLP